MTKRTLLINHLFKTTPNYTNMSKSLQVRKITILALVVCAKTILGDLIIQQVTGNKSGSRLLEQDETCDMSAMTVDWIPCTSINQECNNAHFPQKMISLRGGNYCPTGCRCYRRSPPDMHRHPPSPPPPPETAATSSGGGGGGGGRKRRADSSAWRGAASCHGGWYFFGHMCYSLTPVEVLGHDVKSACAQLRAEPVFTTGEEGREVVVKLLDISGKRDAWALLHSEERPPTPDWSVWIQCIYGSCKCTTISDDGTWATRNCKSKYLAACRRKPSYRGGGEL